MHLQKETEIREAFPKEAGNFLCRDELTELWDLYAIHYYIYQSLLARNHLKALIEMFEPIYGGTTLDVGCGPGNLIEPVIKKIAPNVHYCVDNSEAMLKAALKEVERIKKNNFKTEIKISRYDLSKIPWPVPDQYFDGVISNQTIEFIGWEKLINEIKRILKPNGIFFAGILTEKIWRSRVIIKHIPELLKNPLILTDIRHIGYRKILAQIEEKLNERGIEFPTYWNLKAHLEKLGFKIIKQRFTYLKCAIVFKARLCL